MGFSFADGKTTLFWSADYGFIELVIKKCLILQFLLKTALFALFGCLGQTSLWVCEIRIHQRVFSPSLDE